MAGAADAADLVGMRSTYVDGFKEHSTIAQRYSKLDSYTIPRQLLTITITVTVTQSTWTEFSFRGKACKTRQKASNQGNETQRSLTIQSHYPYLQPSLTPITHHLGGKQRKTLHLSLYTLHLTPLTSLPDIPYLASKNSIDILRPRRCPVVVVGSLFVALRLCL